MMPGGRLTQDDRRRISGWLTDGVSHAEIARRLSRPTSTITREVNRNGGPARYHAERAQQATRERARRRNAPPARTVAPAGSAAGTAAAPGPDGRDPAAVTEFEERFTRALMAMGAPRMVCRVLACLTTTDSGAMTSAELAGRLQVSPASVSKAVRYLEDLHFLRRELDGRRERYIVDDHVWYRASIAKGHNNYAFAQVALDGARILGPGTPAGERLADTGRLIKCVVQDILRRTEYWHAVITGSQPADGREQ